MNNKEDIGLFRDINEDEEGYLWLSGTKGLHVFDGNRTISYINGNKQYELGPDSIQQSLYTLLKNKDGHFLLQEENARLVLFDPVKRKCTNVFTHKATNGELMIFEGIINKDVYITTSNRLKNTLSIWKRANGDSLLKIYEEPVDQQNPFQYRLAGNNHWIIRTGEIVRLSLDGKETKHYKYFNAAFNFLVIIFNETLYFMDSRQEAIYTWNNITDSIETVLRLPEMVKGRTNHFYVKDDLIYVGSNLNLFILDRSDHTIQDLSPGFIALAKKETPNSLGIDFLKFFLRKDSSLLLCTQADIYRLKKKVPPAEQFRQPIHIIDNVSPTVSFRGLTEDDKRNVYGTYYLGIAKKTASENKFIDISAMRYIKGDLRSTYSIHYWKGHLLWNNTNIDLTTGGYKYMAGEIFSGHTTHCLQNDTLWFFQWNSKELQCYDLLHNNLHTYPLDKEISGGENFGEMNDMIGDAGGQNLWICSSNHGIAMISKEGKLLKKYDARLLSTSGNNIRDLELKGNELWFGCDEGLGVINTLTGKTVLYKNPAIMNNGVLKNRVVFSILPDDKGNFYLGSSYGLIWFDTKARLFYNLADEHPMATLEFNRASVLRTADNRYYMGTVDGLYSFTTAELEFYASSDKLKPVKLYNISIFNSKENEYHYLSKELNTLTNLVLSPFDNNVEFHFSVPEFYKNVYYSYRVKGQNEKWSEYKPDNKLQLYGLLPGKYTLEIKASTNLGDENASYYSLPLVVEQVWYKKWWVISLLLLLVIAGIIGLLRYRFNQKLNRQKELANLRTKISSDLHDDVGTILSGLAMQSQVLTYSAKEEQKASLLEISSMSRDAMEHMRDTVWAMDSRKDKYENLIDRMRDFAERNLSMKKLTHEFIIADIDTKKFITPDKRQAIYLIFKEAITNIIKHCDGKHVVIKFTYEKNNLHLTIHDDGPEKESCSSDGLGLSNMKMRAEKIGGTLTATYDNGFKVELNV